MRVLRNVFRRKLRAALTIFGIMIGVLALVVMGAMAEKMQLLVDGGTQYYGDKVIVTGGDENSGFGSMPMSTSLVDRVERVKGVARATGSVQMMLDEDSSSVSMGVPANITGGDFREVGFEKFETRIAQGRALEKDDTGVVVVGSDLVAKLKAQVGGRVKLRGKYFTVIGIQEKTLTAPDMTVTMALSDAQDLFVKSLPATMRSTVSPRTVITGIAVYPVQGTDPDRLATRIEHDVPDISTMGPKGFETSVTKPLEIFNQIIYAVALISLIIGGLSVINTMTMSVAERTREIGIRKSIGATKGAVMRQFIAESAVIGLLGGIVGLALGSLIVVSANSAGAESATKLFLITTRLAIGSVLFALVLGVISGLYPAWHAASLSPVKALRYE